MSEPFNPEAVAVGIVRAVIQFPPYEHPFPGVTAKDMLTLMAGLINTCPKCGATAWVNIDCDLCTACHKLKAEANT